MNDADQGDFLTIGPASLRMGVCEYVIRKALRMGLLQLPRFGRFTMFPVDELPEIRRKLEEAWLVDPLPAPAAR